MSDDRLRELERRFRLTGSMEDEAAWLRARVQTGQLEQSRLELAAYLGHAGACQAARTAYVEPVDAQEWLLNLIRWDPLLTVRALVAAARLALPAFRRLCPEHLVPVQALESAERWLVCPCSTHFTDLMAGRSLSEFATVDYGGGTESEGTQAGWALEHAAAAVWMREHGRTLTRNRGPMCVFISLRTLGVREDETVVAVRRELIPFALGYSDPVRERVEARQREAAGE